MDPRNVPLRKRYWFETAVVASGLATAAVVVPHGPEAVFSVGLLTAAALSAKPFTARRRLAA